MSETKLVLRKKELEEKLATEFGTSKAEAGRIVDFLVDTIRDSVTNDVAVHISGFGKFERRFSKERDGFNPSTGQKIVIPERNRITFTPATKTKKIVNGE